VPNILIRKPIALLKAEAEKTEVQALVTHGGVPLKRTLSAWSLVSLGIGCIIGAGIFVLTGHAAATNAGPAIAHLAALPARLRVFAMRRWPPPSRSPGVPTPMPMQPWANSSPGSSVGT
jgi:hypothetical protein